MTVKTKPYRVTPKETFEVSLYQLSYRADPRIYLAVNAFYTVVGIALLVGRPMQNASLYGGLLLGVVALYGLRVLSIANQSRRQLAEHNARSHVATFTEDSVEYDAEGTGSLRTLVVDHARIDVWKHYVIFTHKPAGASFLPLDVFESEDDLAMVLDRFRAAGVKVVDRRNTRKEPLRG